MEIKKGFKIRTMKRSRPSNSQEETKQPEKQRKFQCDYEKCTYATTKSGNLKLHTRTHTGEKSFFCNFPSCGYSCSASNDLKAHQRTHTGERPFVCNFPLCGYAATQSSNLKAHIRTHTGEKSFVCNFPSCGYSCNASKDLKAHQRTHTGQKPFVCNFPLCGYAATQSSNLKKHIQSIHSERGIQRRKKEEERIQKLLEKEQIHFDREVHIDFACTLGAERAQKSAKIDFVITKDDTTFLLEVDEHEHLGYGIDCETRRMMDAYACFQDKEQKYVWIRYNPNAYSLDEERITHKRQEKHELILNLLKSYKPSKPMEIVYVDYSAYWNDTTEMYEPAIFTDPDYPDALQSMCVYRCTNDVKNTYNYL